MNYYCDTKELEIKDANGSYDGLENIKVTINGEDFIELMKLSGASAELMERIEKRFESVSEENYSRLLIEEELLRNQNKNNMKTLKRIKRPKLPERIEASYMRSLTTGKLMAMSAERAEHELWSFQGQMVDLLECAHKYWPNDAIKSVEMTDMNWTIYSHSGLHIQYDEGKYNVDEGLGYVFDPIKKQDSE